MWNECILLKIYPITLKWQNENKKWQKESKANLSKYTTASERCVRLAGWLAGWLVGCSHVSTVLALHCFALLCFACLLFIAHVLQLPKTKNQIQNQNKTVKVLLLLLLLLFLHYDYSRKFRADLWVHESPWIGSNSQTNNKQVAPNKRSIALRLVWRGVDGSLHVCVFVCDMGSWICCNPTSRSLSHFRFVYLHTWWQELCAERLVVTFSRCFWLMRILCKKGLLGKKT